jgi:hypothetical protein
MGIGTPRVAFNGRCAAIIVLLISAIVALPAWAIVTKEQRAEIEAIGDAAKKIESLSKKGDFKQAAAGVKEIVPRYEKLASIDDKDIKRLLDPIYSRLNRIYGTLELEGETLPLLKKPGESAGPSATTVSFTKEVAPILVGKCGRCHVTAARGRFQMTDFETLMKGPEEGVVVMPGNAEGSRIIEVIVSGDMPRGGGKVEDGDLTKLKTWITEGAKFDGPDPKARLTTFVSADSAAGEMAGAVSSLNRPTGKETVSFALDIAPVLTSQCLNCHGQQNPRGQFSMVNFNAFLRGGASGGPFVAKKPEESLLIKKIKGTAGDRMPLGRPALSGDVIKKFETWVKEGAVFDGRAANRDFDFITLAARSEKASHEELATQRKARALQTWKTVIPDSQPEQMETEQFVVLGNIGKIPLEELAAKAQAMSSKLSAAVHAGNGPLVKGKITLFVFSRRYDYSEFGQLIEQRELPKHWQGHSRADGVDAYGVMYVSPDIPPEALDALLAEQIAGAYSLSLTGVPNWFSSGFGKAVSAKLFDDNPRLSDWENAVIAAVSMMKAPDDFITQKTTPEASEAASYSFTRFLMSNPKGFAALMTGLRKGSDFPTAFAAAYKSTPSQLTKVWAPRAVKAVKSK